MGRFRKWILGIPLEETTFARRGFEGGESEARARLETIGRTFVHGYHAALLHNELQALEEELNRVEADLRGFAFEGAAMGLALLDALSPWKRNRWHAFLKGPGAAHVYMVQVGAGWAIARFPYRMAQRLESMDPLLRWLAIDGFGFHEGYFHGRDYIEKRMEPPPRLTGYERRAFDQGLGRSLWFVKGADAERIYRTVGAFPPIRQEDLWSGIGLACAYAGGVDEAAIKALRNAAGSFRLHLAQGAAFAAKARRRAGNPAPHTELACGVLCGLPAEEAARVTDIALEDLPLHGGEPAYEIWRRRIRTQFAFQEAIV